jgi:hypothetical protein
VTSRLGGAANPRVADGALGEDWLLGGASAVALRRPDAELGPVPGDDALPGEPAGLAPPWLDSGEELARFGAVAVVCAEVGSGEAMEPSDGASCGDGADVGVLV